MFFDKKNEGDKTGAFSSVRRDREGREVSTKTASHEPIHPIFPERGGDVMPKLSNTSTSSKPVRLIFPFPNCKCRVITLGDPSFEDGLYTKSKIARMTGDFVRLTENEATRLVCKINDLENQENKFRLKEQSKRENKGKGYRLSRREVIEQAVREVFAGARIVSRKKLQEE